MYLTEDELDKFANTTYDTPNRNFTRDMFLFLVLDGYLLLRYEKPDSRQSGESGRQQHVDSYGKAKDGHPRMCAADGDTVEHHRKV